MPISAVSGIVLPENLTGAAKSVQNTESFVPFGDLLKNAVEEVNKTNAAVSADQLKIASGDSDALHNITINAAKADLALETLVAVRNKALDAYNEIMRITL